MRLQAEVLDRLIRTMLPPGPSLSVLVASCGIGLALAGYRVHATDPSPAAMARAQREAETSGAHLTVGVADLRWLTEDVPGTFDVAPSCDNALRRAAAGLYA